MRCPDGCVPSTDPRYAGTCAVCARILPDHVLSEPFVRDYYEALHLSDAADEAWTRLLAGGRDYTWTGYLDADNVQDAREEILDTIHRAIFLTLKSRLDHDQERAAQVVERCRRAAVALVGVMREFEAIRELEK